MTRDADPATARRFGGRRLAGYRRAAVAVLLLIPVSSGVALAPQSEQERGVQLALEAQQASAKGDYEEAILKYRAALEAAPDLHRVRFELGRVLAYLGRYEESAAAFALVVQALPENGAARRGEVTALLLMNRYGEARRKLQEGLDALPRDGQLAHTLARILATAPVDQVRDGRLALHLALKVYEIKKTFETSETLAMAYAEVGEFDRAIEIQRGLLARAESGGDDVRAEKLRQRLLSYLRTEPWRATSAAEIAMATEPPAAPDG